MRAMSEAAPGRVSARKMAPADLEIRPPRAARKRCHSGSKEFSDLFWSLVRIPPADDDVRPSPSGEDGRLFRNAVLETASGSLSRPHRGGPGAGGRASRPSGAGRQLPLAVRFQNGAGPGLDVRLDVHAIHLLSNF